MITLVRRALAPAAIALVAGAGLVACEPVVDPARCNGTLGRATVEDVHVPSGSTCTLDGTRVGGDVTIARDGALHTRGAAIDGNVQGAGHRLVTVRSWSYVGGSVQLEAGGEVQVADSLIDGNIQVDDNRGKVGVARDVVDGDVQLFGNRGGTYVSGNRVGGNLQCKANSPAPYGGGNTVHGDKEDQCRAL